MNRSSAAVVTVIAMLATAVPIRAHHALAAEFDANSPIK
jgi:hypothetical protein